MTTETGHLVWIAPVPWDGIPGTDRAMATEMTRYTRVLWVDPPVSAVTPTRLRGETGGGILPSLAPAGGGITRLTPVALPGLSRPGVRATTAPLLRTQIRWALRRLRIRPAAVVAGYLEDVLGRWDGAVDVLYITDDHVAGAGLMGLSAGRLQAQERRAAARADVLAVVSPRLAEHWSALGADPVLIPNGCFPVDAAGAGAAPADTGLARPVVGLVGQLTERINLRLLDAVAAAGLSLLLVGPYNPRWEPQRFAALIARPNVRYAGRVPAGEVPSYLAAIDVGLTPYADTPFNQASFPMKTLEYFSAGLPVVSTDLPGSRWLRDDLARSEPAATASSPTYRCRKPRILASPYSSAHLSSIQRTRTMSDKSPRASSASIMLTTPLVRKHPMTLDGRRVPFGQPELARFQQAPHDLSTAGMWQRLDELDLLRGDGSSQLLAGMTQQRQPHLVIAGEAVLQHDERLYHLAHHRVRLADDRGLGNCWMIGQRILDFERADQMPGGLDDIVSPAHEPEIAVSILFHQITGQVEPVGEALAVSLSGIQIAAKQRRPARLD